ncbi:SiaB family protein kinase [Methylobacterium sp. J-078]|uniref:SiaB family protein kinase n=1 Tax=Methylobacterium sp. J-078 TaxID=2836657 RepID=UPI001FB9EFA7|nr:SiaB family protein kinase [Methylobacterium sp. J-078]MCJ2045749.1 SiaB family protein kinase [Methylobacterium sp. J-078]
MLARDFMNFFDASRRQGVILSFGGDISENVLFSLGEVLKLRMSQGETDASVAKRVFAVFVEQAQNVIRYSADKVAKPSGPAPGLISNGVIVVGMEAARFYVLCGNEMPDSDVPSLRARLDHIASLNSDELKAYYREKLRQPPDEGSLGGSIGLIEIARRSSAPVEYDFQELGSQRSFFCLKAYI